MDPGSRLVLRLGVLSLRDDKVSTRAEVSTRGEALGSGRGVYWVCGGGGVGAFCGGGKGAFEALRRPESEGAAGRRLGGGGGTERGTSSEGEEAGGASSALTLRLGPAGAVVCSVSTRSADLGGEPFLLKMSIMTEFTLPQCE